MRQGAANVQKKVLKYLQDSNKAGLDQPKTDAECAEKGAEYAALAVLNAEGDAGALQLVPLQWGIDCWEQEEEGPDVSGD